MEKKVFSISFQNDSSSYRGSYFIELFDTGRFKGVLTSSPRHVVTGEVDAKTLNQFLSQVNSFQSELKSNLHDDIKVGGLTLCELTIWNSNSSHKLEFFPPEPSGHYKNFAFFLMGSFVGDAVRQLSRLGSPSGYWMDTYLNEFL